MEIGTFEERIEDAQIFARCKRILGSTEITAIHRVCERYGTDPEEVRKYDVYNIDTTGGRKILKKVSDREAWNYETFLRGTNLPVPQYYSSCTEGRVPFPFYMTEAQKDLFVQQVYKRLKCKPEYGQYLFDIKLAVLNEYVEFLEAGEDEDGWYLTHAKLLAQEILAASAQ